MGYATFPNGVYGFNLSAEMLSHGKHELLNRIEKFIECLENGNTEFEGDDIDRNSHNCYLARNYDFAFWYFYDEIRDFMLNDCEVKIPDLKDCYDPESDSCLLFSIEQIWSEADLSCMESEWDECPCNEGDLIMGIGIGGFPNDIKLDSSFIKYAFWYLWTCFV